MLWVNSMINAQLTQVHWAAINVKEIFFTQIPGTNVLTISPV